MNVKWKALAVRLARIALLAYAVWLIGLYFLQDRMIFPGWKMNHREGETPRPEGVESIGIEPAADVRVEAWFQPGIGRSAASPGPLVVFAHGNAEFIDESAWLLQTYRNWGVSLLLIEYRGYGASSGTPSQAGIVDDFERVTAMVCERAEVDPAQVVYHGRSIGAAVAAQLALRRPPAGLIFESAFTDLASLAPFGAPTFLIRHSFRTIDALPRISSPVLLLHGASDDLIPPSHSQRLAKVAGDRGRLILLPGGHNDFPLDEAAYWAAIRRFLEDQGLLAVDPC